MTKHQGTIVAPVGLNIEDHEMDAARAIASSGIDVVFKPQAKGDRVKNADFVAGGILWEVKSPTSCNLRVVQKRLREATHQSRDIIFDSRRMKRFSNKLIQNEVTKWAYNLQHVRRLLYINHKGEVIKIK